MIDPPRQYPPRPIVGVGVVVFKGDRFLVVQRGTEPGYGQWSVPGGVVELGETVREAAVREVREECGLIVDVGDLIDVYERISRDETGRVRYHYILLDYVGTERGGDLCLSPELLDARWILPGDVDSFDFAEPTLGMLRKAVQMMGLSS